MDTETLHDSTVSIVDGDLGGMSNNNDCVDVSASNRDVMQELKRAKEWLVRVEMDIACSSEKICNLSILMMRLAERENNLEAAYNEENDLIDSAEKVLEFDFLSEIFTSTVGELGDLTTTMYNEILSTREVTSSCKYMGEALHEMEEKLQCAEETVKQSQEQISEMTMQSKMFRRSLGNFSGEEKLSMDKALNIIENGAYPLASAKIEMQTSEQRRNILRMLEKSLATELDLEQKLSESKQAEEELKKRLHLLENEVNYFDEQMTSQFQRLFEDENAAEVFKGASIELVGQLQSCHFSLNCALKREAELNSKIKSNAEGSLNSENDEITVLKDKLATSESLARNAEAKLKLLEEANLQLKEKLETLTNDKKHLTELVPLLERQLIESGIQLQQAMASVEASEENQIMLCSSIKDMESVIGGLKGKVTKAEEQANYAEDKWISLSESNTELNDEVSFLRGRLECLETSLNQSKEGKDAIVKEVTVQAKVITDLVMQLEMERENLYKQASSLMKENKILMDLVLHDMHRKPPPTVRSNNDGELDRQNEIRKQKLSSKEKQLPRRVAADADTILSDFTDVQSTLENVHTIDAGHLGFRHALVAVFVGLISIVAVCYLYPESCPFGDLL